MTRALLLACVMFPALAASAQQGPIEPTWVYTTHVDWMHLPRVPHGPSFSLGTTLVVILFPEGQYVEVLTHLERQDKTKVISAGFNNTLQIRAGTWERTDDRVIRIHSRVVWKDEDLVAVCDANYVNCRPREPDFPGPFTYDTCALEGSSPTHLARTIHCKRLTLNALHLNLNAEELKRIADQGLAAVPKQ